MKRPSDEQIEIALAWLDANEGDAVESAACKAVSKWLEDMARAQIEREVARKEGIAVSALRRAAATRRMPERI
jgi:putative alpha-1,2-mannosidase